jgi:hypothetical protein
MIEMSTFHRAARNEEGFWAKVSQPRGRIRRVPWPDFGVVAEIWTGRNAVEGRDITYRACGARFLDHVTGQVLAHAKFDIFQSPGGAFSDTNFFYVMDEEQSALDFAGLLAEHFKPIRRLFRDAGRSIVHLDAIEVRHDSKLKGRGTLLGWTLMKDLHRARDAGVFVFETFPLQYRSVTVDEKPKLGEWRDLEGFDAAKAKLRQLYRRDWDAQELDEDHMFCSTRHLFEYSAEETAWHVARSRPRRSASIV